MSAQPSLLRNMAHYLSGRILLVVLGFATFPLMTRMLSVSDYGVASLALRVVLLLTVLSKCGLQYSAGRFFDEAAHRNNARQEQSFYTTLVFGPMLTAVTVTAVYLPLLWINHARLADPALYRCLLVAPALVLVRTLQSLLLSLLRNEGRSKLHSALEVATKILTLGALIALLISDLRSAFAMLVATAASEGVIVLLQLVLLLRRKLIVPSAADWGLIRSSLVFGAPLIAYELSSIVLDSGDRFLVRHYLGDRPLGLYSAAYNVSSSLQDTVMTPLNLAIFPVYMRLWNTEGRQATTDFLSRSLSWFCVAIITITGLSILCSRDAIVVLASARFEEAHRTLQIIVPALMLYSTHIFLNVGLFLQKRTGLMALLVFLSAMVNIALNLYLIPRAGVTGAAWATLISYAVLIASLTIINQRIFPLNVDFALIGWATLSAAMAYEVARRVSANRPVVTLAWHISLDLFLCGSLLLLFSRRVRKGAASICFKDVAARKRPDPSMKQLSEELHEEEAVGSNGHLR